MKSTGPLKCAIAGSLCISIFLPPLASSHCTETLPAASRALSGPQAPFEALSTASEAHSAAFETFQTTFEALPNASETLLV